MSFNDLIEKIAELPTGPSDTPEVPPRELVAVFVRFVRGLRQWKQLTLADFAGVSLSTIERVERGEQVNAEALDRVAVALGYQRGYFTSPRCRMSVSEAAESLKEKYDHLEVVSVRPLRTQTQVRAVARCDAFLMSRENLSDEYSSDVAELAEWLDLASFILADVGRPAAKKVRLRKLYNDILECVQRIEHRGINILCGVMEAPQDGLPNWKAAVLSLTPKLSDPGGVKRKVIFVDRRCAELPTGHGGSTGRGSSSSCH